MDLEQLSIITTWSQSGTNLAVALLHTLWEGVLIAGMLFLMLLAIPAKNPRFRYALSLLSLLALVCAFYGTYTILEFEERVAAAAKPAEDVSVVNQPVIAALSAPKTWLNRIGEAKPATSSPATSGFSIPWMQWFLWFWFAGVVCMLTRFFFQVKSAQQLHRSCSRVKNVELSRRLERLRERLQVFQAIPLYIHNTLTSPVTTGIFKPVILLPAHIVTGSPMEYIDAILAHELAHIRRKDYLVNLLQMLVEAFFFFNPAVWWISRQIRLEREACCDAMAVGATGERMAYANALASIPQQAGRWLPEAVPAFGDRKQPSNLLNRIRRLAIPQHRPAPVFSWTGLACFLLCSVMAVACFEKSTEVVADAATQWILSEEQMEEMADIDKSYGKPKSYQDERDEGKKVEVKGTVTTFDGKPLPKHTHVMIHSSSYNSSANYGVSISAKDNQFSDNVQYGRIYISVAVDGYAAGIVGPLDPGKNGTVPAQDIVLQKGVPAKLRLVNQEKQPIPDAEVEAVYWVENFSFGKWLHLKSVENGIVTIENYNGHKMRIGARAAGYQFQQEYFVLPTDKVKEWAFDPAPVTRGKIVAEESGQPIEGAKIKLIYREGPMNSGNSPEYADVLAKSNARGAFIIDTLREDCIYQLLVEAEGYERKFMENITAGKTDLRVELGPEINVKGKIVGELGELKEKKRISYTNPIQVGEHNSNHMKNLDVEIIDEAAHFEIRNLWEGALRLYVLGEQYNYPIDSPMDDLVIEAGKRQNVEDYTVQSATRTVVISFKIPEGSASPKGWLKLNYLVKKKTGVNMMDLAHLPVENGRAKFDIPVPGKISCSPIGLIGYWFKEKNSIEVPEGEEPYPVTIEGTPAGTVYGNVTDAEGRVVHDAFVTPVVAAKAPGMEHHTLHFGASFRSGGDGYAVQPLPMGGTYALVVHDGNTYVQTEPFQLTDRNPTVEKNISLPKGITVQGRVVDEEGNPLTGIPVHFSYDSEMHHSFGFGDAWTGTNGIFNRQNVNPDVPGQYRIRIHPKKDYQSFKKEIDDLSKPIVIRLKKGKTLTGYVVEEESGKPIPKAKVRGYHAETYNQIEAETPTDENGFFRISTLGEGEYKLRVNDTRTSAAKQQNVYAAGQPEPVTLEVSIYEWSDLKPAGE